MNLTEREKWLMLEAMQHGALVALLSEARISDSDLDEWLTDHGADGVTTEMALLEGAPSPWQPIETAPTHGQAFLVWCPQNTCTFAVYRREDSKQFYLWGGASTTLRDQFSLTPTRWMPLPDAPK